MRGLEEWLPRRRRKSALHRIRLIAPLRTFPFMSLMTGASWARTRAAQESAEDVARVDILERTFTTFSKVFIFKRNLLIYWIHKQYPKSLFCKRNFRVSGLTADIAIP